MTLEIIISIGTIFINAGISTWIYKVLSTTIANLKDENKELREKVDKLEASGNRWFRMYNGLLAIVNDNKKKCRPDCPIQDKVVEFLANKGDVV